MTDAEAKAEAIDLIELMIFKLPGHGENPDSHSHSRCEWCRIVLKMEDYLRRAK